MASAAEGGLHCVVAGGSLVGLSAQHVAISEQATADYLAHAAAGRRS